MAPHSSTLGWKIPWAEEPGRLQSMGSRRVGHDWATSLSLFTFMHWRRKWQPTPVFLPGESQGRGSLVGFRLWGRTESDTAEATSAAAAAAELTEPGRLEMDCTFPTEHLSVCGAPAVCSAQLCGVWTQLFLLWDDGNPSLFTPPSFSSLKMSQYLPNLRSVALHCCPVSDGQEVPGRPWVE